MQSSTLELPSKRCVSIFTRASARTIGPVNLDNFYNFSVRDTDAEEFLLPLHQRRSPLSGV